MSTQPQQITEFQILTSYLLTPSPLPTILPYSAFLTLIPSTYRNNPSYSSTLKRLYRDLQFQRDITLAQVQDNIERECGGHAATLRADLARRIAIEEGEMLEDDGRKRKRRRLDQDSDAEDQTENEDDSAVREEDFSDYEDDEDKFFDPLRLQVQQSFYDDPSRMHPAANVMSLPPDMMADRVKSGGAGSRYHTRNSLLAAMENASQSLESEIAELEAECDGLKEDVTETVSGLSDLRYGRANRKREEAGNEDGAGEYKDVLDALTRFKEVLKTSSEG